METKNATSNSSTSTFINPINQTTMAQTNMQILSSLLQDNSLNTWTQEEMDEINNLPPLNHFTTGDAPQRFLYDDYQGLISYIGLGSEKLTEEPLYCFPNIEIYDANLSTILLD